MHCASCGTENQAGRKFCGECGSRLARPCPACGTANQPGDKFCGECGSTLDGSAAPPRVTTGPEAAVAERRLVTVVFADLVGFTPFAEERDAEEVRDLLTRYFDESRDTIERFGGTVEKFIGDAVMAVWGAPVAREDDAERAVRAAMDLVDAVAKLGAEVGVADLDLRVGVLTGEAAVGTGQEGQAMVMGDLVNTASRLQSLAPPGTVLVGDPTRRITERAIAYEAAGEHPVKGRSEPVAAWRAVRVVAMRGGEQRVEGLEGPFVGRDEELRLLKDLLHATGRDRRARLVSVVGIAGVGKSRLVWEFQKYVDGLVEDVYWHQGRSPAYGDGVTFWALGEMVKRRARIAEGEEAGSAAAKLERMLAEYVPDETERRRLQPRLAGLLGLGEVPSGERGELFSAWRTLFERVAERGTTVLVFEDLHWADPGLLEFVEELPEWSRDRPILVITLARPELLDRRPDWGAGRRDFVSLHLGPLPDDDMRSLVDGLVPGIPEPAREAVVERAAGVPLYAMELVRMLLVEERLVREGDGRYRMEGDLSDLAVPESLNAVIGARLDRLDPADRRLVQDASVLGHAFTVEALAALAGQDPEALRPRLADLVRRELLEIRRDPRSPERGQYAFLQSLIREVAYGRLGRAERRQRHLAVADHFEGLEDEELIPIIASHYLSAHQASGDGEQADEVAGRARTALRQAADRAAALHSHEQALAFCEQALAVTDREEERVELWERAARSAHALARHDVAEEHARRVLEWWQERGDPAQVARATTLLGRISLEAREPDRAVELFEAFLADVPDLAESPELAALGIELARAYLMAGRGEEATEAAERGLRAAEHFDLIPAIAQGLITRGTVLGSQMDRLREGVALLKEALELALEFELPTTELRARGNLAYLVWADDPALALANYEQALELSRRLGEQGWSSFFAGNLAGNLTWHGELSRVLRLIEDRASMEMPDRERIGIELGRARILALQGDLPQADRLLEPLLPEAAQDPDPQFRRSARDTEAAIHLYSGRFEEAFRLGMQIFEEDPFRHPGILFATARAAILMGDPARMRRVIEALEPLSRQRRTLRTLGDELAAAAAVVEDPGDPAAADLLAVPGRWAEFGTHLEAALSRAGIPFLLPGHPAAREAEEAAREALSRFGAHGLVELFDRLWAEVPAGSPTGA